MDVNAVSRENSQRIYDTAKQMLKKAHAILEEE